ncbi:RNA-directed DNA polymerase, eukaryota, reverse transcriptase zinc-binding domain protein [Tanacetum coccineum]
MNLNQSAFVPGRLIQDNILITQELLKGYNRKQGPQRCALKIDIAKAYDTVNWSFLKQTLIHFGFHEKIIGWIMTCVTSAAFSICINKERYGYLKSGRGLRQGDLMSPYLFTLVMEVLSLIIQIRVSKSHNFRYHRGCKDLKLTQLCFVDHLLTLCNGDYKSIEVLKEGLMKFNKISGLIPNMNKSTIFFGSVKAIEKRRNLEIMPFTVGQLPMKYLGVPLITKNIVLASMHIYWASLFLIPKTNVEDIEKVLKGFLWSQGDLKKGAAKVVWKTICTPKSQGGLGLKRLGPWNEALLCKHLWNEVNPIDGDSGAWKAILSLRSKIKNHVWHEIGDGKSTSMWFDKWNESGTIDEIIPFKKRYEASFDEKENVADLIVNGE